ncbi:MAG: response regulator [Bdellovibrionaceae bacterium]|nr:response regulator [Pseudobdellovibrionaceae bacterium]
MLPRILLVEDEADLRELVFHQLGMKYNVEIVQTSSGNEAVKILEKEEFDLIISDYTMPNGNGAVILNFIDTLKKKPIFLLFTGYFPNQIPKEDMDRIYAIVTKPSFDDSLNQHVEKVLSQLKGKVLEANSGYLQIRKKWISTLPKSYANYFLKLPNDHYVLYVKNGVENTDENYQKLLDKKEEYIYIPAQEAKPLLQALFNQFDSIKNKNKTTAWQSEVNWLSQLNELANQFQKTFGWSKEVAQITNKCLESVEKNMHELPQLRDFLLLINNKEQHILYSHASSLAYIAIGFMTELKALQEYEEKDLKSLTAAAIIHDIALDERIYNKSIDFNKAVEEGRELKDDDFKKYMDHPELAAHIALLWKSVPENVHDIILQHHERPDGRGFPFHLKEENLLPLSCVFILAHELTTYILKCKSSSEWSHFFEENKLKYKQGKFKNIFEKVHTALSA